MTPKARIVAALVAATLTFASSPVLWAQDASHKLTAMDEFQLQLPADPQLSPDGKRIAYVRRFADPMTDKRYSNLWIINTDGTDHRPLTTGNRSDVSPRWSPDGMRLTYLSDADGKQQIYIRSPISSRPPTPSPGAETAQQRVLEQSTRDRCCIRRRRLVSNWRSCALRRRRIFLHCG